MGDSVPKARGARSTLLILPSNRASRETDSTTSGGNSSNGRLFLRDAQAACRCNCLGSKLTPFFQMIKVMAAIFRARVRRAMLGRIPFATRAAKNPATVREARWRRWPPLLRDFSDRQCLWYQRDSVPTALNRACSHC